MQYFLAVALFVVGVRCMVYYAPCQQAHGCVPTYFNPHVDYYKQDPPTVIDYNQLLGYDAAIYGPPTVHSQPLGYDAAVYGSPSIVYQVPSGAMDYYQLLGYDDAVYGHRKPLAVARQSNQFDSVIGPLTVVSLLGRGTFGEVYKALSSTGLYLALKLEMNVATCTCMTSWAPQGFMSFAYEYEMMSRMQRFAGFPRLYGSCMKSSPKYYLMELLGKGMDTYMRSKAGGVIESSELKNIARQMVDRMEAIHSQGLVMYDVHLGNFLIHKDTVYVVDLALAHSMGHHSAVSSACTHVLFGVVSSTAYATDDLTRLVYMLVFIATGSVPWMGKDAVTGHIMKASYRASQICTGKAAWLLRGFRYIRSLKPGKPVDYTLLKQLFMYRRNF